MGIESVLKAGLKALPDNTTIKGAQVPNALKKMGVKDEELKFAGINIDSTKSYSKADLEQLEAGRQDKFGRESATKDYQFYSLEQGKSNPTYKENVYTMEDKGVEGSRYTSSHFPDVPNYLMHTRTFDDTLDGTPTRVLQEIQSDLHQQGRAQGYGTTSTAKPNEAEIEAFEAFNDGYTDRADDVMEGLHRLGYSAADIEDNDIGVLAWEAMNGGTATQGVPKSPYEKSWLAKGIERELDQAVQDGRQQLAIPIKGEGISNLKRAEGVQGWYEDSVVNTAKKIAKQNGMDFELKTTGSKSFDKPDFEYWSDWTQDQLDAGTYAANLEPTLEATFGKNTLELRQALNSGQRQRFEDEVDRLSEGTHYAIIKPKAVAQPDDLHAEFAALKARNDAGETVSREEKQTFRVKVLNAGGPTKGSIGKWLDENPDAVTRAAARPNLKLYSSPAAAVGAGYASLKAGGTDDDIRFELGQAGYESDDIDSILADTKKAQAAIEVHGYPEEEVMAMLKSQEPEIADVQSAPIDTPVESSFWGNVGRFVTGESPISSGTTSLTPEQQEKVQRVHSNTKKAAYESLSETGLTAAELLSSLKTISPNMTSVTTRISGYFGNEVDARKQAEAVEAAANQISELSVKSGIPMAYQRDEMDGLNELDPYGGSHWYRQDDSGAFTIPVDEGFWMAMKQEGNEIGLSVAGGIGGFKATQRVTSNPYALFAGSLAGAMIGAGVGTEIDYLRDAVALHEDMSAEVAAHKALTAAEASVIGDLVGYPLVKGAGTIWEAVKTTKDFLLDGNTAGAHKALKDIMFLDDSEIADLTLSLQKAITNESSGLKPMEQQIQATLLTQPGGEAVVKAAGSIDARASAAVAKSIDDRAKDVLTTTATLTDENIGRIITTDLSNYTSDVKQFYGDVKAQVAKSPRINDFAWDYNKLAIKPVMDTLRKNIMDPTVLERFKLQQQAISGMSDSRTLTDLLELRQMVNDFKFNKRISKAKDFDALNKVLSNVDSAIKRGAQVVMEEPDKWLGNYALAKTQYAKMKGLERNVIARALRLPGLTEESAVRAMTKYITALDGTFQEVMTSLPKESRKLAEGAVIDVLANKFTAGLGDGMRAVHFPLLSAELDKVSFTMPEARKAKAALKEMAEVFRNDVPLSQSTGNIQIPHFQSYLTSDPRVRLEFELATSIFNYVKRLSPAAKHRNLALVMKTAKLLEQPLNAKLMKDVMDEVGGDTNLVKQLVDLQREAARAKAAGDVGSTKINFYGSGPTLSTKGSGTATKIPVHRIATYDMQKTTAGKYGIDINDKVGMADALKAEGYIAVQQGSDKVRRLN